MRKPVLVAALLFLLGVICLSQQPQAGVQTLLGVGRPTSTTAFTWDPANAGTNALFANGNRDYTGASSGSTSARTILGKSSGKWYLEITIAGFNSNATSMVGFGQSNFDVNGLVGNTATSGGGAYSNGSQFVTGVTLANSINIQVPQPQLNDIVQLAMDLGTGQAWYGVNNTYTVGNPATGTTPWLTWTPGGTWYFSGSQYGAVPYNLRLAATASFSPPSGFALINQ